MSPKLRGSAPDPPTDSEESGKEEVTSEEEEVNGGSGSESDSETESEEPTKKPAQAKKPDEAAPPVKKPETPKPSIPDTSSSEDDSGSESESKSEELKQPDESATSKKSAQSKKPNETEAPKPSVPDTSSDEDDSGSESESKSEESKQPDESVPSKKPAQAKIPAQAETPRHSSSDEDDSGSDSESGTPVTKPVANIKPVASKPVVVKTPNSKANGSLQSLPTKSVSAAGTKRPANYEIGGGGGEGKDTKRLKKKPENNIEENGNLNDDSRKKSVEESEKKGNSTDESRKLFQRLWSEDDEIAMLKGMVDYLAKKNADPATNVDDFHEFIKKSLNVDVSRTQLQSKICRLRRKYTDNADKEKNGKELIFAKDHDQKTFQWSKKVWGKENTIVKKTLESPNELKSTKKPKIVVQEVEVEGNNKEGKFCISEDTRVEEGLKLGNMGLRNSGIEEWIKENIGFLDEEKRAKMEKRWKNFKIVEGELYAKKLELMLEETHLILDALKSSAT